MAINWDEIVNSAKTKSSSGGATAALAGAKPQVGKPEYSSNTFDWDSIIAGARKRTEQFAADKKAAKSTEQQRLLDEQPKPKEKTQFVGGLLGKGIEKVASKVGLSGITRPTTNKDALIGSTNIGGGLTAEEKKRFGVVDENVLRPGPRVQTSKILGTDPNAKIKYSLTEPTQLATSTAAKLKIDQQIDKQIADNTWVSKESGGAYRAKVAGATLAAGATFADEMMKVVSTIWDHGMAGLGLESLRSKKLEDGFLNAINSPQGKKIISTIANFADRGKVGPFGITGKYKMIKTMGAGAYEEAVQKVMEARQDPRQTNAVSRFWYQLEDTMIDTGIGVLLTLGVSRISPAAGRVVGGTYWSALSADEQIKERGEVYSPQKIAIDVALDSVLGSSIETMLERTAKGIGERAIGRAVKGAIAEGGTENLQSFLKYGVDFKDAKTEEEKQKVVDEMKNYVVSGGALTEFLIGGLSGGGITVLTTSSQDLQNVSDIVQRKADGGKNLGVLLSKQQVKDVKEDIKKIDGVIEQMKSEPVSQEKVEVLATLKANKTVLETSITTAENVQTKNTTMSEDKKQFYIDEAKKHKTFEEFVSAVTSKESARFKLQKQNIDNLINKYSTSLDENKSKLKEIIREASNYDNVQDWLDVVKPDGLSLADRRRYTQLFDDVNKDKIQEKEVMRIAKEAQIQKAKEQRRVREIKQQRAAEVPLAARIKPYKLKSNEVFHGTAATNLDNILEDGFIEGSKLPESAFRSGGYGALQNSISFSTDPNIASNFTGDAAVGVLFRTLMSSDANVVTINNISHAEELNELIPELKKMGVDAVYLEDESEVVVINKKVIEKIKDYKEFKVKDTKRELADFIGNTKYKIGEDANFDITEKEAEVILSEIFPNDKDLKFVSKRDLGDGVYGKYTNNLINVLLNGDKISSQTLYHESFHHYYQTYLSAAERKSLNKEVADKFGDELGGKYGDQLFGAEEWLAHNLELYVKERKTFKGRIKQFFKSIIDNLRRINNEKQTIIKVYNEFLSGKKEKVSATADVKRLKTTRSDLWEIWREVKGIDKTVQQEPPNQVSLDLKQQTVKQKPIKELPTEKGVSKVAKSIGQKAIDRGLTKEVGELAGYTKKTVESQTRVIDKMIGEDIAQVRQMVRGEMALPAGVDPSMMIARMEEYNITAGDLDIALELMNSPLATKISESAATVRLAAERIPDSLTVKSQEIKKAREATIEKRSGKSVNKRKSAIKKTMKAEMTKAEADAKEKATWDKFLESIEC